MLDPRFGFRTGWFERALTVCAVGMLLGLGLCGSLALTHSPRLSGVVMKAGALLFFGSLAALLVVVLVQLIVVIVQAFRR